MRLSAAQLRRFVPGGAACVLAGALAACGSSAEVLEPSPGAFAGPPLRAEILAGEHVVVATLPTPGYEFTLDGTREAFQSEDVFVTLRRPNPAVLYPQVLVDLRLSTGVPRRRSVRVYARQLDYTAREGEPFKQALEVPGSQGEAPGRPPVKPPAAGPAAGR